MEVDVKEDGTCARRLRRSMTMPILLLAVALTGLAVHAHTPLLYIEDNGDGTIYVEGAFSDGSSGAGMTLRLENADGETLWEGTLDDFGSIESVPIPQVAPYYVVFEGGPGHIVKKEGISPGSEPDATPPDPASVESEPSGATQPAAPDPAAAAPAAAETSSQPAAWSPAATLSPEWSPNASGTSEGSEYAPALWAIVGLLSFIVLQLLFLGGGVMFLAGWKLGVHRTKRSEIE